MDDALRTKICRLLAGIVVADDDLDDKEDAFIDRMLAKFGLPSETRDAIFPIIDRDEAATEMRSLPKDVQLEALALLVEAAIADGKVVPEERDYLRAVADAIGVGDADIDARIARAMGTS